MDEEHQASPEPVIEPAEPIEEAVQSTADRPSPVTQSGLDEEEFETPSGRYLGLFGVVGAVVGIAVGIQQGNVAFGMAIGLAIGVAVGMILNTYTTR